MRDRLAVVILAAGKGTRMKSKKPKVLHSLLERPMLGHIIKTVKNLSPDLIGVVIGYGSEEVRRAFTGEELSFIEQKEQLGTGHALKQAEKELVDFSGQVLVLCGDTPLLQTETLEKLVQTHREKSAKATVLTTDMEEPYGYGRIIRSSDGHSLQAIVEQKDLDFQQENIKEINAGTYVFDSPDVFTSLKQLDNDNVQGEYYLTDIIRIWAGEGKNNIPFKVSDSEEVLGINNRADLSRAAKVMRKRINRFHQLNGVTIEDPEHTYIGPDVVIGSDTLIRPGTFLEGNTRIGEDVVIGPHTTIKDSRVEGGTEITYSHVLETVIGPDCTVGPYARLRPGTRLEAEVKVGDFVEIKKSKVGTGSKVPHLSYVGDAEIGPRCNIGAGTIFANYDGEKKHPTRLGTSVFIGSNNTLVAPLQIGDGAKTGGGAVVTRDVADNTTVAGVPARPLSKKKKN